MKNDYALTVAKAVIDDVEPYKGHDAHALATAIKPGLDRFVARRVEKAAMALSAMEALDDAVSRGDLDAVSAALDRMKRDGVSGLWFAVGRQLFQERHGYDPHPFASQN